MFYAHGRLMEKREVKTKKGDTLKVCVLWVQNGKYSNSYEFIDWDNHLASADVDSDIFVPCSVFAGVGKAGNKAYLNFSIQGSSLKDIESTLKLAS